MRWARGFRIIPLILKLLSQVLCRILSSKHYADEEEEEGPNLAPFPDGVKWPQIIESEFPISFPKMRERGVMGRSLEEMQNLS